LTPPLLMLNVQTAGEMQEHSQDDQSKEIHWCSIGSCRFSRSPQRLITEEADRVFRVAVDEDTSSPQRVRKNLDTGTAWKYLLQARRIRVFS